MKTPLLNVKQDTKRRPAFMMKMAAMMVFCCAFVGGYAGYAPPPTVSVVMPVYNRADMVGRAIDSILAQTFTDFEFIIVDDGSDDKTPAILKDYAQKDKRIRIITHRQNCGIACARNTGQDAARGKYIAIMDSDDKGVPVFLEKEVQVLEDHPEIDAVSGLVGGVDTVMPASWVENPKSYRIFQPVDETAVCMLFSNCLRNVTTMIRRSFIVENNIRYNPDLKAGEDYDYWVQMVEHHGALVRISNFTSMVRFHRDNSKDYYQAMYDKTAEVKKRLHDHFYPADIKQMKWNFSWEEKCQALNKIVPVNRKKGLFNIGYLESFYIDHCPPADKKYIYLQHAKWQDFFILADDQFGYLHKMGSGGFYRLKENILTIHWTQYGSERFEKGPDDIYHLTVQDQEPEK